MEFVDPRRLTITIIAVGVIVATADGIVVERASFGSPGTNPEWLARTRRLATVFSGEQTNVICSSTRATHLGAKTDPIDER